MRLLAFASLLAVASLAAFDPIYFANVYYKNLKTADATVMGLSFVTQNNDGVSDRATASIGVSDVLTNQKLWQDNAFRMNTGSDTLFYALALRLVSLNLLPPLTAAIPSQYFPRGVTDFYNPSYPSVPITLEMLLRHTSTLTDTGFDAYRQTTPNGVVTDFTVFCESFFTIPTTNNGVTTYSAAQAIWAASGSQSQPGATNSYRYARANTALLAFIINAAILGNPSIVTGSVKTVAGYLQEQILAPLGMASTFRRNVDGAYPRTTLPSNMDLYSGLPVTDITANGNARADVFIHPAYPSDYMFYTSTENVGRLVRALFIGGAAGAGGLSLSAIGEQMKASPLLLSTAAVGRQQAQTGQAYGLMYFSGSTLCAATRLYAPAAECILTDRTVIFGSYSVGRTNMWGYFCLVNNGVTSCSTAMLHYFDATAKDPTMLFGVAGIMMSDALGAYDGDGSSQSGGSGKEFDEGLNGLWVALGTCLVIVFVIAAAYFTEYLVQPAPVPAGVVAAPPPIPQAYGQVEQGMYSDGAPGFYHD